jgi:DNA-binding transcriptional MocR family regulator
MESKYRLVIDFIKQEISSKKINPGGKLPSIREISKRIQCNKITVIRAYNELEREHIVCSVPKSGYYLVSKADQSQCSPKIDEIDFCGFVPDDKRLPYIEFQHCLNQAINIYKGRILLYNDLQGILSLRRLIQKQLQNIQVFTSAENIFVTTGSQQTLFILAKMPFPNGKNNVLVEQPTYPGILKALELNDVKTIGMERNFDGINLDELENIFKNGDIKFFYTIPRFHNPTGYSFSYEQKKKIINLAQKYNVYIVEDDYLGELELNKKTDSMFSYDNSAKVIYVKSYSKILLPWLRIGIVILPNPLINMFKEIKICSDISSSILSQGALEIYINNGMYEKHVRKIKQIFHNRMSALKNAYNKHLLNMVKAHIPDTGFSTCIELPVNIKAQTLVNSLMLQNVIITSADSSFLSPNKKENYLRISIRNVEEEKIEQGIKIISKELARILAFQPQTHLGLEAKLFRAKSGR